MQHRHMCSLDEQVGRRSRAMFVDERKSVIGEPRAFEEDVNN